MDDPNLWISLIALAVSLIALTFTYQRRSIDSYARLMNSFNDIIAIAIGDDEVRAILDNLFFNRPLPKPFDSDKRQWCYIRVLNIFQRYYLETRLTGAKHEMKVLVLEVMLADLLRNGDFLQVLEECRYTQQFRQECETLLAKNKDSQYSVSQYVFTGPMQ